MCNQSMINLQDAGCFLMEQLTFFHDHSLFFLLFILSLVAYVMVSLLMSKFVNLMLLFNEGVEFVWTLFPSVILVFIALPSLKVLYLTDEVLDPSLTFKAIGHQWNWSYEYSDFANVEFSSYMKSDIENDEFRLLEVDNRVVVPVMMKIRVIVTSTDVIHSWTVPSLGVKMDANPGRLNQFIMQSNRMGLFYGQCSEICGTLHSFMPICVEVVDLENFFSWIKS
uniref:cytochrome c oxidase subunit II n=1 Tax=Franciscoloa roseicapillae TaxID=2965268 RepID=UPI0026E3411C|nr:cytochrome c oxidase subunit II [Franciscoloa roseicapillae]WIM51561.1 cytochrome c oxidase subunit 2 [Franciscoloa roseicapillae]WIM51574.1 cytochrome c oxidase subunit 2 [Franciscoloa roseicapillae]